MCQLFETIKCKDGILYNLEFNDERFNKARKEKFGVAENFDLKKMIEIPENCKSGLFRCRVMYSEKIEKIEFLPHQIRNVSSLKLTENDSIDYHLKYANREVLQKLFEKREGCDDILIIKNGYITDSFTANVIFFDGKNWWTPDTPLLPGTQRARLLCEKKISECRITPDDLSKYNKAGLINAMQDLENMPVIEIKHIFT
jgi:4-amino-4-deoxychorismate lyase